MVMDDESSSSIDDKDGLQKYVKVCGNTSLSTQFFLLDNTQRINYLIQRQYFILRLQKGVSHDQYRKST